VVCGPWAVRTASVHYHARSSWLGIMGCHYVELIDLFQADQVFKNVNSFDKSLAEKLAFIEQLDKKDKIAFYAVLDAFIGKKKLKDALSNVSVR
jgi:hypothetical protein